MQSCFLVDLDRNDALLHSTKNEHTAIDPVNPTYWGLVHCGRYASAARILFISAWLLAGLQTWPFMAAAPVCLTPAGTGLGLHHHL
jgi:hypothetical protein